MTTLRDRLLGTWTLVSYEVRPLDGSPSHYPMGEAPEGLLIYSPDGFMSAQLMKPNRRLFGSNDWNDGTPDEYKDQAANYLAYSGPFQIDEQSRVARHTMQVALFPNWVGQTQIRVIDLDGDRLHLSPPESIGVAGRMVTIHLKWQRAVPDAPSARP